MESLSPQVTLNKISKRLYFKTSKNQLIISNSDSLEKKDKFSNQNYIKKSLRAY